MPFDDDGFVGLLSARALRDPDGIYARFNGEPMSYGALDRQASSFAAHLRRSGIAPGERVAVMMRNSTAAIACVFGLAKAGVAWVPVNAQQRGDGLRHLLGHSGPRLVIVDEELAALVVEALPPADAPRILVHGPGGDLDAILADDHAFDEPPPAPDAVFAIMYTSGTTGRPKGVVVSHRMLRLAAEGVGLVSAARPGEVLFVWEPLYHIGGAQLLPLPMIRDVVLAMVERFSASSSGSRSGPRARAISTISAAS